MMQVICRQSPSIMESMSLNWLFECQSMLYSIEVHCGIPAVHNQLRLISYTTFLKIKIDKIVLEFEGSKLKSRFFNQKNMKNGYLFGCTRSSLYALGLAAFDVAESAHHLAHNNTYDRQPLERVVWLRRLRSCSTSGMSR